MLLADLHAQSLILRQHRVEIAAEAGRLRAEHAVVAQPTDTLADLRRLLRAGRVTPTQHQARVRRLRRAERARENAASEVERGLAAFVQDRFGVWPCEEFIGQFLSEGK